MEVNYCSISEGKPGVACHVGRDYLALEEAVATAGETINIGTTKTTIVMLRRLYTYPLIEIRIKRNRKKGPTRRSLPQKKT